MKSIEKVIFFGANYRVAQAIQKLLPLCEIVCERERINRDIINYAGFRKLRLSVIRSLGEFNDSTVDGTTLGISCGFGLIFDRENIERFGCGIWNIHYGLLPDYRGRHPVSWAFLKGDQEIGVSIHVINEAIDQGYLLVSDTVSRDMNDTLKEVDQKIEALLDDQLLARAIENYYADKFQVLGKGVYHESLVDKYNSMDPCEHNADFIFNLFRSQAIYGGVTVKGRKYRECDYYLPEFDELYKDATIVQCQDGIRLALK